MSDHLERDRLTETSTPTAGSERFRTIDFVLWVGAIAVLLTLYSLAEWGTTRYYRGLVGTGSLEGAALPEEVTVWTGRGPGGIGWMFKRFYDTPERAEFDRAKLRHLLGFTDDGVDFWALWVFHFSGESAFEVDREATRVQVEVGSVTIEEISIARRLAAETPNPYVPVSVGWALGEFEAGGYRAGPVALPPRSAKKFIVAFDREIEASEIRNVRIGGAGGGPVQLAGRSLPSRELESFLSQPQEKEFPHVP